MTNENKLDGYMLERWNDLEKAWENSSADPEGRQFYMTYMSKHDDSVDNGGVMFGWKDDTTTSAIMWITPDQARAIATMLVYAAQEAEK